MDKQMKNSKDSNIINIVTYRNTKINKTERSEYRILKKSQKPLQNDKDNYIPFSNNSEYK